MQVQINLNDEQVDEVLVRGLQDGFKINLEFQDEPNYYELNQAFRTLLAYYMGDKAFDKFIKPFNRSNQNAKRLTDAHNGL
jgi:DNA-binding GntR family transcriptional regulator